MDEIKTALEDSRGVEKHQRRLAFLLSTGSTELIELYLHKVGIMKPGARIKHTWLRRKNVKEKLKNQVTGDLDEVGKLEEIIDLSREIELSCNDLAYGSPIGGEEKLSELINKFLEIKGIMEDETGDKIE